MFEFIRWSFGFLGGQNLEIRYSDSSGGDDNWGVLESDSGADVSYFSTGFYYEGSGGSGGSHDGIPDITHAFLSGDRDFIGLDFDEILIIDAGSIAFAF